MPEERAVVDRIEDGQVGVLLVGDAETEMVSPRTELPEGAAKGSVLRVTVEDGRLVAVWLDAEDTEETRRRVEDKMRRLRDRGRRL